MLVLLALLCVVDAAVVDILPCNENLGSLACMATRVNNSWVNELEADPEQERNVPNTHRREVQSAHANDSVWLSAVFEGPQWAFRARQAHPASAAATGGRQ